MTITNLRRQITTHSEECALLLGNGINNYSEIGCSWTQLLQNLHDEFLPELHFKKVEGITYTEIFDTFEISIIKKTKRFETNILNPIKLNFDISHSEEIFNKIQKIASDGCTNLINPHDQKIKEVLESFKKANAAFKEIGGSKLVLLMSMLGNNFGNSINSILILYICQTMATWKFSEKHRRLTQFAQSYDIPILTTNYDNLFAKSINARFINFSKNKIDETLPISCCYTTQSIPDVNKFAIWHLNGMLTYPKSIVIGLSHYMRNLEKIRKLIIPTNYFNAELFENIIFTNNAIKDTWINLIFTKELYIFGLSLDTDEVLLRWLLLERAKLFSLYQDKHKGCWYVLTKKDYHKLTTGKKYFLKSIGCEIVIMEDYDAMYNAISI